MRTSTAETKRARERGELSASHLSRWLSHAVLDRWLFRPGGKYNIAIARIAIASALWLTIVHHDNFYYMAYSWDAWLAGVSGSGWHPKGLVKFADWYFGGVPPGWVALASFELSRASIILMALGLFTRFSQVVATISTLFCVSLQTSFGPYWSHAYNVQLLAALAFMFARSGDVWSLDAMIRKFRKKPQPQPGNVYWWPVIFAELATALFMFGAFYQKFRDGGFNWALSDNIRNSLGVTWLQYRSDPPAIAEWIASNPAVWQTAGMLQLFTQSTTMLAAFLIGWPVFRLIFGGLFFSMEIMALGHVFRFWHPFWAPLCLLSIDFEFFWARLKARARVGAPFTFGGFARGVLSFLFTRRDRTLDDTSPAPLAEARTVSWRTRALVAAFGVVFFGYYLANLHFRLGETQLNYPFSSMAFYSETRAMKPYREHTYWPIYTGRIDVYETAGAQKPVSLWYREGHLEDQLFRVTTIEALREIDKSTLQRTKSGYYTTPPPGSKEQYLFRPVSTARIHYSAGLMSVTPYPQPLDFVNQHMGLRAVRDDKGFRALIATAAWDENAGRQVIEIEHAGFKNPKFEILARFEVREKPQIVAPEPLKGEWRGATFYVDDYGRDGRHIYSLIKVTDDALGISEVYYGPDNFQSYR